MQGNGETDSSTSLGMTMAGRLPALQRGFGRTSGACPYKDVDGRVPSIRNKENVANNVRRYKTKSKQKGEFDQ